MAASYIECQNLTVEETCDLFHFNKIIAIFAETSHGVLHAGDLLAQHLVVIGAFVCIYLPNFAIFVDVRETTTRKYLKENSTSFNQWKRYHTTVPPLWEIYHYILIKPSCFVKTWCENTYKHYLHQQTIIGKTHFTTNSLDYIMLYLVRVRNFSYRK